MLRKRRWAMIISRSPARYGFLIATIKLLSIATFGKTSKIHTSAGGNINTPHGGKTADAAESETRRWPAVSSLQSSPSAGDQNQISHSGDKINDAHVSIKIKKCSIDAGQIIRCDDAMLPEKHNGNGAKPDPIDDAEAGSDADQRKKTDRYDMKNTRQPQCSGSAESHRHRMEALFTVEIAILE